MYILKAEMIGFASRLNVGYEKKRGVKDDPKVFDLSYRLETLSVCIR